MDLSAFNGNKCSVDIAGSGDAKVGDAPERFLAAMHAAFTILTVSATLALVVALRGVLGRSRAPAGGEAGGAGESR